MIRPGDELKNDPFTICVVSNPALEAPWGSGRFVVDPITTRQSDFDRSVRYVEQALFGMLPGQAEIFLGDPAIGPRVRLVSLFVRGLAPEDANSLVGEDTVSTLLVARRRAFVPLLARYGLTADVVYSISHSELHHRASAWFTSDDDARAGVPFTLDGVTLFHRYYNLIPGTVAQHSTGSSLTALHEFGHALSSYSNGQIVDPRGWQSYHCELHDARFPAVMDDYWRASGGVSEHCQHDRVTRRFLLDRVRAKQGR